MTTAKVRKKSTSHALNQKKKNFLEIFQNYFKNTWKESPPLIKLFKTESKSYIYDTGTNKIMSCDESIYALLENLLEKVPSIAVMDFLKIFKWDDLLYAFESIQEIMKSQNVLKAIRVRKFGAFDSFEEYEELITSSTENLCLEICDTCNLRCAYCVYSDHIPFKRNHGKRSMSIETARLAINYLKYHSSKTTKTGISFYGGEPLCNFNLIQELVPYASSLINDKPLSFSLTTNATLLAPEMADFFKNNNFSLLISIDGPKEIHDKCRKDLKGDGSFERVINGLHCLFDTYGEAFIEKVHLNMVYTPPWSSQRLNRLIQLWDEIPWLPRNIRLNISYPSRGTLLPEKFLPNNNSEDKNLQEWSYEVFKAKFQGKNNSNPIANYVMERNMASIMKRLIYTEPLERYALNGCCIPGVRKLFVSVDGTFHLCERICSDAPAIGNVHSGLDMEVIKKIYIDEYTRVITPNCSRCWAVGLCRNCYIDAFNNGKLDIKNRVNQCTVEKQSLERLLTYYCSLMEQYAQELKYLYDYELL